MIQKICKHGLVLRDRDGAVSICRVCSTKEEIDAARTDAEDALVEMAADNARLRGVVKSGEWEGQQGRDADRACPWCGALHDGFSPEMDRHHFPECAAFTPEGNVR